MHEFGNDPNNPYTSHEFGIVQGKAGRVAVDSARTVRAEDAQWAKMHDVDPTTVAAQAGTSALSATEESAAHLPMNLDHPHYTDWDRLVDDRTMFD